MLSLRLTKNKKHRKTVMFLEILQLEAQNEAWMVSLNGVLAGGL